MMKDLTEIKFNSEYGSTEDINKALLKDLFEGRRLYWIIGGLLLLLVLSIVAPLFFLLILSIILTFSPILVIGILTYYYNLALRRFYKEFAKTNGLRYERSAPLDSVSGKLFSIGKKRKISIVVSGYFDNHPIRSFIYRYDDVGAENSRICQFTVWEITFEKTEFPHIFLLSLDMPRPTRKGKSEEKISLREEFSDKFVLYVRRGYQVEALQIFTPEVLRMLSEKGSNFSIEFAGRSLYIYDDTVVDDKKKLKEMFDVARSVFDKTGPLINRLHDDFEVMHKYYGNR